MPTCHVLVIGLGEVGQDVARLLEREGHRVTAIDTHADAFQKVADIDLDIVVGNGASPRLLREVNAANADLLVACTDNETVNLMSALIAKKFGTRQTVARLHHGDYEELVSKPSDELVEYPGVLGVDFVLNPSTLVAIEMIEIARNPGVLDLHVFAENKVELAEIKIEENSECCGRILSEIDFPEGVSIGAIIRTGKLFVPRGSDHFEAGDRLYVFGRRGQLGSAVALFAPKFNISRVAMFGDERVGLGLAEGLNALGIQTMLLVDDREQAERLADQLPTTEVLLGDGTDLNLLTEEQIGRYDLYFSVTDDDENNLISALLAKRLGVPRVGCLVHRPQVADIYRDLGIDMIFCPRQIATDRILSFAQTNAVSRVVHLQDGHAEVIELTAEKNSRITKSALKEQTLPEGVFIGGILRAGVAMIPNGESVVEAGDLVVVMTLSSQRKKAEKLFRGRSF